MNGGTAGSRNVPTLSSASGVWSDTEQYLARRAGIWPTNNLPVSGAVLHLDASAGQRLILSGSNIERLECNINPTTRQFRKNSSNSATVTTVNGRNAINITYSNQYMWFYDEIGTNYTTHTFHIVMQWLTGDYPFIFGEGVNLAGQYVGIEGGSGGGNSDNAMDWFHGYGQDIRATTTGIGARNSTLRQFSIGIGSSNAAANCRIKHNNVSATLSNPSTTANPNFKIGITTESAVTSLAGKMPYGSGVGTLVFCECVLYDRVLSDAEMTSLYDHFKIKWGTV